jgi:hypothetical protein
VYNPWSGYRVTGTWEAHRSYSYGGTDWPLGYGTALRAPATGTLTDYGWVGSAGRRAGLVFDQPVKRVTPASKTPMYGSSTPYYEHDCDMVTFIFQHAKSYQPNGRYLEGAIIGHSGASANGKEWGGDAHLHGHGLCIHGARVDFMKFIGAAAPSGLDTEPIPTRKAHPSMYLLRTTDTTVYLVTSGGMAPIASGAHLALINRMFAAYPGADTFNALERDIIHGYIKAAYTADDAETERIIAAIREIPAGEGTVANPAGPEAIAAAVDAILQDDFASIPGDVNDDAAARLQG